jgi:hypothetical protein
MCGIVHFSRHGPPTRLKEELNSLDEQRRLILVNNHHNTFPILFQPLIEPECGWLGRLRVLLEAGARGDVVYEPWHCSVLHMLFYHKIGGERSRLSETSLLEAVQLLLKHGARRLLNLADTSRASHGVKQRTALMQAASDGRFQVCRLLLREGANPDAVDSHGQSFVDILFYLKHSNLRLHRDASAGYSCMDLYGLVNQFELGELLTDELRDDCKGCGTCRYLLATVPQQSDEEAEEEEQEGGDSDSGTESQISEASTAMSVSKSTTSVSHPSASAMVQGKMKALSSATDMFKTMRL